MSAVSVVSVVSAVNRLPSELRHVIARRYTDAYLADVPATFARAALCEHPLSSARAIKRLRYILVVRRHTPTSSKFAMMGVFELPRHPGHLTTGPLKRGARGWHASEVVCNKRATRYAAAVFRVRPLHGPWRARDRSPRVALEPLRAVTAVHGGATVDEARTAVCGMTNALLSRVRA